MARMLAAVASLWLACALQPGEAAGGSTLTLPLQFHLGSDLRMTKGEVEMIAWVTKEDIERVVLPEVNRIWRDAGIRFELVGVVRIESRHPPERAQLLDDIVAAKRNRDGKSDPERIAKLGKLVDFGTGAPAAINIYLVPYLGERSQGHTKRRERRSLIGEWSDKKLPPGSPPRRCALREERPFVRGSLSRTVAHELGHILGLRHPDKRNQAETGLLMGGRRPGYRLTGAETETARRGAVELRDGLRKEGVQY